MRISTRSTQLCARSCGERLEQGGVGFRSPAGKPRCRPRPRDRGAAAFRGGRAGTQRRRSSGGCALQGSPRRPQAPRRDRLAGAERAASGAPLHAAVATELLDRYRHLSARLLHDEAQSAAQREAGAVAGLCRASSLAASEHRPRRAPIDGSIRALAQSDHRHGGGRAAARRRRAWRDLRHDVHQGRARVLVPESAHGTNPATAATCGYAVDPIPGDARGRVDLAALKAKLGPDVAAIMLTNPNTCGLFEDQSAEIAAAVHAAGAYFYLDGANMNALLGRVRSGDLGVDCMHLNLHKTFSTPHGGGGPGSGPVALAPSLARFAPLPWLVARDGTLDLIERKEGDAADALGRIKAFHGQMGMFVRALAFLMSHGGEGLRQVSGDAVLNANYLLASLKDVMTPSFGGLSMHEVLFDDRFLG